MRGVLFLLKALIITGLAIFCLLLFVVFITMKQQVTSSVMLSGARTEGFCYPGGQTMLTSGLDARTLPFRTRPSDRKAPLHHPFKLCEYLFAYTRILFPLFGSPEQDALTLYSVVRLLI